MELLITILAACAGGRIGLRLRIPAGALIGSMFAVAILNICFDVAYIPPGCKLWTQIATGVYLGAKITKEDLPGLRHVLGQAGILCVIMIGYTVLVGLGICRISNLSVPTALFAMAPAGISDMTLAAMDFEEANPAIVVLIQSLRVICTVCFIPPLIRAFGKHYAGHQAENKKQLHLPGVQKAGLLNLAETFLAGMLPGIIAKYLGIPGGAIAFSMMGSALFQIRTGRGYMPLRLRRFIQFFAGGLIGCTIGRAEVLQLWELGFVSVLAVGSFIVLDIIAALVITKMTKMDLITALFSCAPGGLSDMALIAEEMGSDSVTVAGMHTVRLVGVIAIYPVLIKLLISVAF